MDIKLNVISRFKHDTNSEKFIELFNYKLLKIIIHLENQSDND